MKVCLMSGSLRKGSHNTALLNEMSRMLPSSCEVEWLEIGHLPFYNEDIESETPTSVKELRSKVSAADMLWIATPEYNHHTSGVMKNAIDWLSRPYMNSAFMGKKVVLMGAGSARAGAARVLMLLREMLFSLHADVFRKYEVNIAQAYEKFDADGKLVDGATEEFLRQVIPVILEWVATDG